MNNTLNTLHIIFRACDKVLARGDDIISIANKPKRPFCQNKTEIVKTCFLSLKAAIDQVTPFMDVKVHVVGDALSQDLRTFFEHHDCTITTGVYGNDESLRTCFRYALNLPVEDWVYFCEDDYLHFDNALLEMVQLINHREAILTFQPKKYRLIDVFNRFDQLPLFIHPSDYPDRYSDRGRSRFSLIFQSPFAPNIHWRQIQNTTFTFVTQVASVRKFEKPLMASCMGAHDGLLSRLYRGWPMTPKSLCVSPIPSLAAHLHPHTMPLAGNWAALFEHYHSQVINDYPKTPS